MTVEFQSISKTNSGYKIFCTNFKAARALNKKLQQYKNEGKLYTFKEGEEAIFYIQENDYNFAVKALAKYKCLY